MFDVRNSCLMACEILFCSKFLDILEKSWRRSWRKPANAKRSAFQANAIKDPTKNLIIYRLLLMYDSNWYDYQQLQQNCSSIAWFIEFLKTQILEVTSAVSQQSPSAIVEESLVHTIHKKWSFPLRISPINVTKSPGNCGFGHIYCRNP